ncbi:MAG TPA: hypothetical protein DCW68_02750 [Rhodospirillaceae bacterium]|nr:hypothetical protein [Rhodospirillaceae bacterium]
MVQGHGNILQQIEAFLSFTGMSPTEFGRQAMSDPAFVFDLRSGRDCRLSTIQKAERFMGSALSGSGKGASFGKRVSRSV